MVTGDKFWITYGNIKRKRLCRRAVNRHKRSPSQYASQEDFIVLLVELAQNHSLLLSSGRTFNSGLHCPQLDSLKEAIAQKRTAFTTRGRFVFYQDITRQHTSVVTHQKFQVLSWVVLKHPPLSPVLASSDYQLFLYEVHDLADEEFVSKKAHGNRLSQFFANFRGI